VAAFNHRNVAATVPGHRLSGMDGLLDKAKANELGAWAFVGKKRGPGLTDGAPAHLLTGKCYLLPVRRVCRGYRSGPSSKFYKRQYVAESMPCRWLSGSLGGQAWVFLK